MRILKSLFVLRKKKIALFLIVLILIFIGLFYFSVRINAEIKKVHEEALLHYQNDNLERVLELSPDRIVAYLNIGDVNKKLYRKTGDDFYINKTEQYYEQYRTKFLEGNYNSNIPPRVYGILFDPFLEKVIQYYRSGKEDEIIDDSEIIKEVEFDLEAQGLDPDIKVEHSDGSMVPLSGQLKWTIFRNMYLLDYNNDGETDYILIRVVYEGSGRIEDEFFFKKIGPEEYEYIDLMDAIDISYDYFYDYNDKVYGLNEYKNNDHCSIYVYSDIINNSENYKIKISKGNYQVEHIINREQLLIEEVKDKIHTILKKTRDIKSLSGENILTEDKYNRIMEKVESGPGYYLDEDHSIKADINNDGREEIIYRSIFLPPTMGGQNLSKSFEVYQQQENKFVEVEMEELYENEKDDIFDKNVRVNQISAFYIYEYEGENYIILARRLDRLNQLDWKYDVYITKIEDKELEIAGQLRVDYDWKIRIEELE